MPFISFNTNHEPIKELTMNMIALNTTTQPRQTKRATVKVKAPIATKSNIDVKPAVSAKHSNHQSSIAKRLVNTKSLSREDWLQFRKQGIGSSDAAAACGIHPYLSMLELWMIKTGRITSNIDESIEGYSPL